MGMSVKLNTSIPMKHKIELLITDKLGCETDRIEFDSMKEAKSWVKKTGLSPAYWERRAESADFAKTNVCQIQLLKNGECEDEWTPEWAELEADELGIK